VTTDVRVRRCVVGRSDIGSGASKASGEVHDATAMLRGIGSSLLFPCYLIPEPWTIKLSSGTSFCGRAFGVAPNGEREVHSPF